MHHSHFTKGHVNLWWQSALTEPTFVHYRAGYLDGYRKGIADATESNEAKAEHSARVFYAMTAEDADSARFSGTIANAWNATMARREAGEKARRNCTYTGGPVDFLTGRSIPAEKGAV